MQYLIEFKHVKINAYNYKNLMSCKLNKKIC